MGIKIKNCKEILTKDKGRVILRVMKGISKIVDPGVWCS